MRHVFNLCPKCKDRLVEQIVDDFSKSGEIYCPNCGSEMDKVFDGDKKEENTVYKITLNRAQEIKEKYLDVIMQMGNFSEEEALEKIGERDSISFEGDLLKTYLNLELADKMWDIYDYTVTPLFPYERIYIARCDCGERAVYKAEKINDEEFMAGFFCEKCRDYIWYDICDKIERDLTWYQLKIPLKEGMDEGQREIMGKVNQLHLDDKEVLEDEIIIRDVAKNIEVFLEIANAYHIAYEINPPYFHKIPSLKKEHTEEDADQTGEENPDSGKMNVTN
jgi:hypothetical protein